MFYVASFQFGYPMFAANLPAGPQWSDRADEAHQYDHRDARETKLAYWRAYAEACGLNPAEVRIVEAN